MTEFLLLCFSGPLAVASVIAILMVAYWLFFAVGAVGFELLDFDLDLDTNATSFLGAGLVPLRWLNLGDIPIMLWFTVFSFSLWGVLYSVNDPEYQDNYGLATIVVLAAAIASALITKVLTQPMRGRFEPKEPIGVDDLIGRYGTVATREVTRTSGQVEVTTDAAPLLLNARSIQSVLAKGEMIQIVDYDDSAHCYLVERDSDKLKTADAGVTS